MRYVAEPSGKVLYWEGDAPQYCYLLLSGKVASWHKVSDSMGTIMNNRPDTAHADSEVCATIGVVLEAIEEISKPAHLTDLVMAASKRHHSIQGEDASSSINERLSEVMGVNDAFFGPGSIIGEYALLNDTTRIRTMVCVQPCKFLVLARTDFDRVVKEEMLKAKVRQLCTHVRRLLAEFDIFKNLEPKIQSNLSNVVRFQAMQAGQVIFEQGDNPDFCYIILKGEVTVWITKSLEKQHQAPKSTTMAEGEYISESGSSEQRPTMVAAGVLAREKCSSLATMLSTSMDDEKKTAIKAPIRLAAQDLHHRDDSLVQASSNAVAALGPGSLFGELAMLNDHPRNATVSCFTDCEFLVMNRTDFDIILKADMKKAKDQKVAFLHDIVPGVRTLQVDAIDRILYYFTKESAPRNHFFFEQGEILDGSIYFIWQGSVESYFRDSRTGSTTRRGIMLRGSVFGAVPAGSLAQFSIVSTSSPCEVLRVKPESRKHFPDCVIRSLREVLDRSIERRSTQCSPLAPMGSVFQTLPSLVKQQLPQARNRKVPRPLSGKIPSIVTQGRASPNSVDSLRRAGSMGLHHSSVPTFKNIFRREIVEVDYEAFDLDPGETMAMTAKKPQKRERKSMRQSTSLPALDVNMTMTMRTSEYVLQ